MASIAAILVPWRWMAGDWYTVAVCGVYGKRMAIALATGRKPYSLPLSHQQLTQFVTDPRRFEPRSQSDPSHGMASIPSFHLTCATTYYPAAPLPFVAHVHYVAL